VGPLLNSDLKRNSIRAGLLHALKELRTVPPPPKGKDPAPLFELVGLIYVIAGLSWCCSPAMLCVPSHQEWTIFFELDSFFFSWSGLSSAGKNSVSIGSSRPPASAFYCPPAGEDYGLFHDFSGSSHLPFQGWYRAPSSKQMRPSPPVPPKMPLTMWSLLFCPYFPYSSFFFRVFQFCGVWVSL